MNTKLLFVLFISYFVEANSSTYKISHLDENTAFIGEYEESDNPTFDELTHKHFLKNVWLTSNQELKFYNPHNRKPLIKESNIEFHKILFSDKDFLGTGITIFYKKRQPQTKMLGPECEYNFTNYFGIYTCDGFEISLNAEYETTIQTCLKLIKSNTVIRLLYLSRINQYSSGGGGFFPQLNLNFVNSLKYRSSKHGPIDLNMINFIKDYRRYTKLNRKLEILNKKLFPIPIPSVKEDVLERLKWMDDEVEKERNSVKGFTIHYYRKVLGVSRVSSKKEIKRQYRMLSLKFHPDKNTTYENINELTDVYIEINTAYDILKKFKN